MVIHPRAYYNTRFLGLGPRNSGYGRNKDREDITGTFENNGNENEKG